MPIISDATTEERQRLLGLFPIAQIRENWPDLKGRTKEELCLSIAQANEVPKVSSFIDGAFSCCKQHVYIFDAAKDFVPPASIINGEQVVSARDHALYIARVQYSIVLRDPLEETTIDFLWPVRIYWDDHHIRIRFVVLEKNLSTYFDRPSYTGERTLSEDDILGSIETEKLTKTDLHKGIKAIWAEEFMDTPYAKYKKAKSLASEKMDAGYGIRQDNPEVYEAMQDTPLFNTLYIIDPDQGCSIGAFVVDCSNGFVSFPQYSGRERGADFVIQKILTNNS
jgi:hypothetical protein